jgi:release factor glutamine methyltransferase
MPADTCDNAMVIFDVLKRSVELVYISDTPSLDIEVLLCHVLRKDRSYLYTWPDQRLTNSQQVHFDGLFRQRLNGKPVAYITKKREFWSLEFKVSPVTIIPRPETELLVEKALSFPFGHQISVLDLGTGTGAVALALASEKPLWKITAVDIELDAVELAEANRQRFDFDNVCIYQSDWFSGIKSTQFDLIVTNPPYISPKDEHLKIGDVRFEPSSALVSKDDGLSDIHTIIYNANSHLKFCGWLMMEHGYDQGKVVRQKMTQAGFSDVRTFTDLSGLERVSACSKGGP